MRQEISAGGVVFKKRGEKIHLLLLKDQNEKWTFPKGLVESGEDHRVTAQREIGEETGLTQIEFFKELEPIKYWYRWEGELIRKTVYYFLFEANEDETPKPQAEEGISEVEWFLPTKAWEIVGYPKTNKKILEEVFSVFKINLAN